MLSPVLDWAWVKPKRAVARIATRVTNTRVNLDIYTGLVGSGRYECNGRGWAGLLMKRLALGGSILKIGGEEG